MGIERERYDQMMQRRTGWDRIKAWFRFPPLPQDELPTELPTGGSSARRAPTGGPIEMPAWAPPGPRPDVVIAHMSKRGFELLASTSGWHTMAYHDACDLAPRGGIVEVEIRVRRVIGG